MNDVIIVICILAAALITVLLYKILRRSEIEKRVYGIRNRQRLDSGLSIWYEAGVPDQDLDAIVAGLVDAFRRAREVGYTEALHLGCYTIAVLRGVHQGAELYAFEVPAGSYRGTVFDRGGKVWATGQCVDIIEPCDNIIAVSQQTDPARLREAVDHEAEHVILAWNDPAEYARTEIHDGTPGNSHPLIPRRTV